jgi:hypothetical protein
MGSGTSYPCPAGYYCPSTGMTSGTSYPCPAGYYCPSTGMTSGTSYRCPAGYYCPTTGMTSGTLCPAGYYCPNTGMTNGTLCPAGFYCPSTGMTNGTSYPCPSRYYCPAGTTNGTSYRCPAGYYCPCIGMTNGTSYPCPAGYYCPSATAVGTTFPCPAGYYCPEGGLTSYPCPAGHYCPTGTSLGNASACPAGYHCPGGAISPLPCEVNTISGFRSASCTQCARGTYSPASTSTTCLPCTDAVAATTCVETRVTWRQRLLVVVEGIGSWVGTRLLLTNTTLDITSPCAPIVMVSADAMSCSLSILPAAASDTYVLTSLYAMKPIEGLVSLHMNVTIYPPASITLVSVRALTAFGTGSRVLLTLPEKHLESSDWSDAGLVPPPLSIINRTQVWINSQPCISPMFPASTLLSCMVPPTDGPRITVVASLSSTFSVSGVLTDVFRRPILGITEAVVLLPSRGGSTLMNLSLSGQDLCSMGLPRVSSMVVCGVPCMRTSCIASNLQCEGWLARDLNSTSYTQSAGLITCNITAMWADAELVSCVNCLQVCISTNSAICVPFLCCWSRRYSDAIRSQLCHCKYANHYNTPTGGAGGWCSLRRCHSVRLIC